MAFVDGSCIGNGKRSAVGGIGAFFGYADPRNYAKRFTAFDVVRTPGGQQPHSASSSASSNSRSSSSTDVIEAVTNQTMELLAAIYAMRLHKLLYARAEKPAPPLVVYTDSLYTVKCATVWYKQWQRNGWRTAGGKKSVQNQALVKELVRLASETRAVLTHVRGHGAEPADKSSTQWMMWFGNLQAHNLATAAAAGKAPLQPAGRG